MTKKALITGITGQDGAYLAKFLLAKGYQVHGTSRNPNTCSDSYRRIKDLLPNIKIYQSDLLNEIDVSGLVESILPDEIYHLASDVDPSVDPEKDLSIFNVNFRSGLNLLKAMKKHNSNCRLYAAGSSLMFGKTEESPQNESTTMNPSTAYGIAKVALFHFIKMYREIYGLYVCMGVLYNHESPERDPRFLPRKISKAVASIKAGRLERLILGNIKLRRDWSFAGDVVISMWKMLQMQEPQDFVIGSGELHSIEELLEIAFDYVGLDWRRYVTIESELFRNVDYDNLCSDVSLAKRCLNWSPETSFRHLIEMMVQHDLELIKADD